MPPTFRRTCLLGSLALLLGTSGLAQTAPWPSKPVKFINSFPPGGPSDILARTVGDVLQKQFNQPFVVDNKAGAAGNVGADLVAKSAGDGHTLLWGIDTTHTINPHIYKTMPFKEADLKPWWWSPAPVCCWVCIQAQASKRSATSCRPPGIAA